MTYNIYTKDKTIKIQKKIIDDPQEDTIIIYGRQIPIKELKGEYEWLLWKN